MPTIRVIDNKDNKIAMNWTFIEIDRVTCTPIDVIEMISFETLEGVTFSKSVIPCKNIKVLKYMCSTSHKLNENVKGGPNSDLIEKVKKFSMLYFSIYIKHETNCHLCLPAVAPVINRSAFELLMNSAKRQENSNIPALIQAPASKKEELRNAIFTLLVTKECNFPKGIGSVGNSFLDKLTNIFWYIDGHAKTMARESVSKLPTVFSKLNGYNCPELSKHRKRSIGNLSEEKLSTLIRELKEVLQCMNFVADSNPWSQMRIDVLILAQILDDYCSYLRNKNTLVKKIQLTPRSTFEQKTNVQVLPVCKKSSDLYYKLVKLDIELQKSVHYEPISVKEYLPEGLDRKQLYYLIDNILLRSGLTEKSVHYVYNTGGPKPSLHFIWKTAFNDSETNLIQNSLNVIRYIEENVPIYERRITKREFKAAYGFVGPTCALRSIFRNLTGDQSAATNLNEAEIDRRFDFALLAEDSDIIVDLRHAPPGKVSEKFNVFFRATEEYLSNDVGVAVQERRHGEELYLAKAISFSDLHSRVKERVPDGTEIPSVKWLRYQFQPINAQAETSKYYRAKINIKMIVQKRQV